MITRSFIAAAVLVVSPATLVAQSELRPGAISMSAGVGAGTLSLTCSSCNGWLDAGRAGFARVGVAVRRDVAMSAEVSGWTNGVERLEAPTVRVISANLTAQWYPAPATAGLFAKAGVGLASVKEHFAMRAVSEATVRTRSPSVVIGTGWEHPMSSRWAILPYIDLNYVIDSHEKINGVRTGHDLGGALVHAGVAVAIRR